MVKGYPKFKHQNYDDFIYKKNVMLSSSKWKGDNDLHLRLRDSISTHNIGTTSA